MAKEISVAVLAAAACALALPGCSNTPSWGDVKLVPNVSSFVPTNANAFNQASVNTRRPVTAADLVDAQGACASAGGEAGGGVGLDMTECQVVAALGAPQAVDISRNERGDRVATMTFASGERAGVYRFVSGRLASVERAAGAAEPPARKPPPRQQQQAKKPPPA